jgi:hypothetical protein
MAVRNGGILIQSRSSCKKRLHRLAGPIICDEGQAMLEFALVALVFLTLVFGIIDFGRVFQSWVTVEHAARQGARFAVTGSDECDGYATTREGCIIYQARDATAGLAGAPAAVSIDITSFDYPGYTVSHTGDAGDPCDEVEVEVHYDHHLVTPLISSIVSHVSITGKTRILNEPFGPCGS